MNSLKLSTILAFFILSRSICFAQVSATYTYDNAERLTKAAYSDGKQILYTYDKLGNRLSMTVIVPCQNPDLVINNISLTGYSADKIFYTLQIKNTGTAIANLGSFAFGAFNSTDTTMDNSDEFKGAIYTGGSLVPNATMNITSSSGFNYSNGKYYLILSADYYNLISECNENNNDLSKLVNPCTSNNDITITGSHTDELISSNGKVTLQNAVLTNCVIVGKSNICLPSTSGLNWSIVVGGCLDVGGPAEPPPTIMSALTSSQNNLVANESPISNISFSNDAQLHFTLAEPHNLSLSVYGDTEKTLLTTYFENKKFKNGDQRILLDTSKWIKGQRYALHLKNGNLTEVLVVIW